MYNKDQTQLVAFSLGRTGTEFQIPLSVKSIDALAFAGSKLSKIFISENVQQIDVQAFIGGNSDFEITVAPSNLHYSAQDGVLFNKDKTQLLFFPNLRSGTYNIPVGVEKIGDYAFYQTKLWNVTIPEGMRRIGASAFSDSRSLQSVLIPSTIQEIGDAAFFECIVLKKAYFRGDASDVAMVGDHVFDDCGANFAIYRSQAGTGFEEAFGKYHIYIVDQPGDQTASIQSCEAKIEQQQALVEVALDVVPQEQLPGSATLTVALYNGNQMVGIATQVVALENGTYSVSIPLTQQVTSYKVILLDDINTACPLIMPGEGDFAAE